MTGCNRAIVLTEDRNAEVFKARKILKNSLRATTMKRMKGVNADNWADTSY
jgi:hypothetical protein